MSKFSLHIQLVEYKFGMDKNYLIFKIRKKDPSIVHLRIENNT